MIPSISNFIPYLGVDENFHTSLPAGPAIFFFNNYNLNNAYYAAQRLDIEKYGGYSFRIYPDKSVINVIVPMAYRNKAFWDKNKITIMESIIKKMEREIIPGLSKHIIFKESASPYTLYRYTLNYKGASYGWASVPSQLALREFRKPHFVKGLYLSGHWSTLGVGISGVIYVSENTAKQILKNRGRKK